MGVAFGYTRTARAFSNDAQRYLEDGNKVFGEVTWQVAYEAWPCISSPNINGDRRDRRDTFVGESLDRRSRTWPVWTKLLACPFRTTLPRHAEGGARVGLLLRLHLGQEGLHSCLDVRRHAAPPLCPSGHLHLIDIAARPVHFTAKG